MTPAEGAREFAAVIRRSDRRDERARCAIEGVSRWGAWCASLCRAARIRPVGARVEVAGLGIRLPAGRLRPDWLGSMIPEATTKPDGARWLA